MNRMMKPELLLRRMPFQRGAMFGTLIVAALLAFEVFNYSTTSFALEDLLGDLKFMGVGWATILALAFCGIDFAGIARLFTPEQGADEPAEVWYLFGAWLLAATMNAMLTWWGVSVAVLNHQPTNSPVMDRQLVIQVVPIFVALMVWVIRVLIIGTFSVAGDHLFAAGATQRARSNSGSRQAQPLSNAPASRQLPLLRPASSLLQNSARGGQQPQPIPPYRGAVPKPTPQPQAEGGYGRVDPSYHPVGVSAPRAQVPFEPGE